MEFVCFVSQKGRPAQSCAGLSMPLVLLVSAGISVLISTRIPQKNYYSIAMNLGSSIFLGCSLGRVSVSTPFSNLAFTSSSVRSSPT